MVCFSCLLFIQVYYFVSYNICDSKAYEQYFIQKQQSTTTFPPRQEDNDTRHTLALCTLGPLGLLSGSQWGVIQQLGEENHKEIHPSAWGSLLNIDECIMIWPPGCFTYFTSQISHHTSHIEHNTSTSHLIHFMETGRPWKKSSCSLKQRCKDVQMCKQCSCKINPISSKIFAKFYPVWSRKWEMSQFCAFWWYFLAHFGTLCNFLAFFCTIWVFWAFYPVLSQIWFVVIYALFWVKLFWLKPCLCKKVVFLHLWSQIPSGFLWMLFCRLQKFSKHHKQRLCKNFRALYKLFIKHMVSFWVKDQRNASQDLKVFLVNQ